MRGGITRTAADIRLSKEIRARDNYTCMRCGKQHEPNSQGLHAAHGFGRRCGVCTSKNPKPHICTRMDPSNLLSLCRGCHQFVDSHPEEKEALWRLRIGHEEYERLAAIANGRRDRVTGPSPHPMKGKTT